MRRVVVTGMGIVSSIGNNAQEVLASLHAGAIGHHARREIRRTRLSQPGSGRADCVKPEEMLDRRAMRFHGGGTAWNHVAMDQAILDAGLEPERSLQRAHRPDHGLGRPLDPRDRRSGRHRAHQGSQARRPLCGAQIDVLDRLGDAVDLVQDQGRRLFDLLGLRDLQSLHRRGHRADPDGQAGRDVRGRLRGPRLDACRCCSTRWARCPRPTTTTPERRLARLRQEPRRLRHLRRRRRAGARGLRARQGARRTHLRRDRRLRRDLRRRRHGGAVRRRRGALHAPGASPA